MEHLTFQLVIVLLVLKGASQQGTKQMDANMIQQGGMIQLQSQQIPMNMNGMNMNSGMMHSHMGGPAIQSMGTNWVPYDRSRMGLTIQNQGGMDMGMGSMGSQGGTGTSNGAAGSPGSQPSGVLVTSQGTAMSSQNMNSMSGGMPGIHQNGQPMNQGVQPIGQGAQTMGQGAMSQGAMGQGVQTMGQGTMSQGTMGQGVQTMGQGTMSQGTMGQGTMGQGVQTVGQGHQGVQTMGQGTMGQGVPQGMVMGGMVGGDMNQMHGQGVFVYPSNVMPGGTGQFQGFQYPASMVSANGAAPDTQLAFSMLPATTAKPPPATVTTAAPAGKAAGSTPFPKITFMTNPKFKNGMINWKDVADAMMQLGNLLNWQAKFSLMQ